MTGHTRNVIAASLLMALVSGMAGAQTATPGRMTVVGEAQIAAAPDMAEITLGVLAENPEAETAVQEIGARLSSVMALLAEAGIEARDMQTSGLTLAPRWRNRRVPSDDGEAGEQAIETFVASSRVTVRLRDLDALGGVLDAVVANGANEFHGIRFGLLSPEPVQDAARRAAVRQAARKAALYAEAAGVSLGSILALDEPVATVQPRMMRAEMAGFSAQAGIPVAAGELEVTASVTITYALADAN